MDEPVKIRHIWQAGSLLAAALLPVAIAAAQEPADPTRPPTAPLAGAAGRMEDGPVLQWVYLSPSRTEAMVSGKIVHVGERVGNAQVLKISESSVVLRSPSGLRTLSLYPGMEKRYGEGRQPSTSGDRSKQQR